MEKEEKEELQSELEEAQERYKILEDNENTDEYNDMLDDVGLDPAVYPTSMLLERADPIAYSVGMDDYNDEEMSELENRISEIKEELND